MKQINMLGIKPDSEPLSEGFNLETMNYTLTIEKTLQSINKIIFSTSYKFLDTFTILNENYVNILISIDIRVDYLCESKNINYQIYKIEKIICICSGDIECSENIPIKFDILDSEVIDIDKNNIYIYILFLTSLDLN